MTDESGVIDPEKGTEAFTLLVKTLTPFSSAERKRIVGAVLTLLGDQMPEGVAKEQKLGKDVDETGDWVTELLTKGNHAKPSENVLVVAAYHYGLYGAAPFSLDEIRQIAEGKAGLTVPARLDKTLAAASRKGKRLFGRVSKGVFRPTVHGEKFFHETYSVRKGMRPKA